MATSTLTQSSSTLFFSYLALIDEFHVQILVFLSFLMILLFITFCFILFDLYRKLKLDIPVLPDCPPLSSVEHSLSSIVDKNSQAYKARKLFVEILKSNPQKWTFKISSIPPPSTSPVKKVENDQTSNGSELDKNLGKNNFVEKKEKFGEEQQIVKKKKKRGKKKKQNSQAEEDSEAQLPVLEEKNNSLGSSYPFTSSSSVTQRKIKQQYDQLVKSHDSKGLTLAQVSQFANCLVQARNDLKHKSEMIQRKFTITKALLLKADRSSYDRISQQIYKLEAEQKRLEEDAVVYNRLQEQLKLSPAYKKLLEISERAELEADNGQQADTIDTESGFPDISFEEFLAQEKQDSFWQKNGKLKSTN